MNIFIVNQNPDSSYNDKEGKHYDYPTSIACGKQIKVGDYLLFNLSKKWAKKLGMGDKRLTGIAKIDEITIYIQKDKEMALASYEWYKKFDTPLTLEQIGGEIRSNVNNTMNKIDSKKINEILMLIIKSL
jgi:hypothetical protein